jgi:hypothetical protein
MIAAATSAIMANEKKSQPTCLRSYFPIRIGIHDQYGLIPYSRNLVMAAGRPFPERRRNHDIRVPIAGPARR